MNARTLAALVASGSLCGCAFTLPWSSLPVAQPSQATVLGTAQAATAAAASAVVTQDVARDGKLRANLDAAKAANMGNNEGPAKVVVDGELTVAQSRLAVTPDPVELAAAADRRTLVESGKAAEARAAYVAATAAGQKLSTELTAARIELANAQARETKAEREFFVQLAQNKKDNDEAIRQTELRNAEALQSLKDGALHQQTFYLNLAGGVCLLLAALGLGFGGLAGLRSTWPFVPLGAFCFGLAQIVSQAWFLWACGGAGLLALGLAGWWVWRHHQLGTLVVDVAQKAASFETVVKDVVPVLDHAYETADAAGKELLQKLIFSPLGDVMDKATQDLVHRTRAEVNTQPAAISP